MPQSPIAETLAPKIRKPLGRFRPETDLKPALKRRLTKKEYKILFAEIDGTPDRETLMRSLRLDENRYRKLYESLEKKLNLDKVKRELFIDEEA
ncbi:hypothetical protein [Nitratifractor sp.]|uniref:hypothetical protein n=1 Tax=Nitratifractor sp. TaxID=2268144 RepID=UPI0025D1AE74|nr:hypothetical protein [Nitratifractor sp.]